VQTKREEIAERNMRITGGIAKFDRIFLQNFNFKLTKIAGLFEKKQRKYGPSITSYKVAALKYK
jgi:hypothetical protein